MLVKYRQVACVILMPARRQTFSIIKCATSMSVFDEVCYNANECTCTQTWLCNCSTSVSVGNSGLKGNANFKYYLTTLPTVKIT